MDFKPPEAAAFKRRGSERSGKVATKATGKSWEDERKRTVEDVSK